MDEYDFSDKIYLSMIENYKELHNLLDEHIIAETEIDSFGYFHFDDLYLDSSDRIYRLNVPHKDHKSSFHYSNASGHNFVCFVTNGDDSIEVLKDEGGKIFGSLKSRKNPSTINSVRLLDDLTHQIKNDHFKNEINDLTKARYHQVYYDEIKAFIKNKGALERLIGVYFLRNIYDPNNQLFFEDFNNNKTFYTTLRADLRKYHQNHRSTKTFERDLENWKLLANKNAATIIRLLIVYSVLSSIVIILLLRKSSRKNADISRNSLTNQETNIYNLMLKGHSNSEIAGELFISLSTVKKHINNIYKKLGITSRAQLLKKPKIPISKIFTWF